MKIHHYESGENFGNTFRVEDGIIKVRYDEYGPFNDRFGHLYYKVPFSYYHLKFEYRFVGKLQLPGLPLKIDSIVPNGAALQLFDVVIFSKSLNPAKAPMASAAYSTLEELWLTIGMPEDPIAGDRLIPLDIDETGGLSALFDITYRFDPLLLPVIDTVSAAGNTPPRVDVMTQGFVPIIIDSMTIRYTRRKGTAVNLETARKEILAYINNLALPNEYSDSRVSDSMYYALVENVLGIDCRARVQWSVADRFIKSGTTTPDQDYPAALAGSVTGHPITIVSSMGLTPTYRDHRLGTADAGFESIGKRNRMLCLDETSLFFSEQ